MESRRHRTRAWTLTEMLVAFAIAAMALVIGLGLLWQGARDSRRLAPRLSLQQASRAAIVRFLREMQEGMEVVSPRPGSTLSYAIIRDKLSRVVWFCLLPDPVRSDRYQQLWMYRNDPDDAGGRKGVLLLDRVRRLTFTARSEGAVQIHLLLEEEGQQYPLLTTVRLRNLASAEEVW